MPEETKPAPETTPQPTPPKAPTAVRAAAPEVRTVASEKGPSEQPTKEGSGGHFVGLPGIVATGAYLALLTALALFTLVELWPHPTPSGRPVDVEHGGTLGDNAPDGARRSGESAPSSPPSAASINSRQTRLCAPKDADCGRCVAREMQLQYESGRQYDPQCTLIFRKYLVVWWEARLLLLVLLAGAIGSMLHAVRSLVAYVGNRNFVNSWLPFYYLSPVSGAMVAFVAYLAIRGGFFSAEATTAEANIFMFVALATIAGLFSNQVLEKLRKVAETAFDKAPPGKNSLKSGKPVVKEVRPATVTVGHSEPITAVGSGFVSTTVVRVNGTTVTPSERGENQLIFSLPATVTAAPGKLEIVAVTPGEDGGDSEPQTLEVTAE